MILGVADNYSVVGVDDSIKSNNIFDFLKTLSFAGDKIPEISVFDLFYTYKKIVVIKCKSSKNVPFYLTKRYKELTIIKFILVSETQILLKMVMQIIVM